MMYTYAINTTTPRQYVYLRPISLDYERQSDSKPNHTVLQGTHVDYRTKEETLYTMYIDSPDSGNPTYSIVSSTSSIIKSIGSSVSIYTNSLKTANIGTFEVFKDSYKNVYFIEVDTGIALNVLDQSNNEISVSNKSIADFKKNDALKIKFLVAFDGTDYYLSGGLYEDVCATLGFTKPVTAVGAIELKVTLNSLNVSPNALYVGTGLIDSIAMQYNGINRNTIDTISTMSGTFFKVSGTQITFGADSDVSLSFCLPANIIKALDAAA